MKLSKMSDVWRPITRWRIPVVNLYADTIAWLWGSSDSCFMLLQLDSWQSAIRIKGFTCTLGDLSPPQSLTSCLTLSSKYVGSEEIRLILSWERSWGFLHSVTWLKPVMNVIKSPLIGLRPVRYSRRGD